MGDRVQTQHEAWTTYDQWLEDERVDFLEEPHGLEPLFRRFTVSPHPSTKDWADSYLAAFALVSQLQIVTFDRGFQSKAANLLLLKS